MKKLEIKEVEKPNLFEEIFPHEIPPHIVFDQKITEEIDGETFTINPSDMQTRDIHITDTTFRDGQQARPPYTVEQILKLFDLLHRLSGPNGVIRQTEFFLYSANDRLAVEKCLERGYKFPEVTGWIRAEPDDLHLPQKMGLKESGLLTSCSDYHIFYKLKLDRKKALDKFVSLAKESISRGVRPRCHLEDVTRADIDGFVIPYVQQLMRLSEEVDNSMKVKIRLCDTMGFGISYPGAASPRSVPKLILSMIHKAGVPPERLEWHGHNDFHKVLANGGTAWMYGCDAMNCTLLGIGERTGNPPLEAAIMEYIGVKRNLCGIDTTVITEIADYYKEMGVRIPPRTPFVGADFAKTRAGIHADGLTRDERIYNIFDIVKLLKQHPQVSLTDKSGSDGVALWVNNFLGLDPENRLKKTKLVKIMRWVTDQYDVENRTSAISDKELVEFVRQYLPEQYEQAKQQGRLSIIEYDD